MNVNSNWTTSDGDHDGGVSYGPGFCISWQRGPTQEAGENGALLIDVLEACKNQIEYFQNGKFECEENAQALHHLQLCIEALQERKQRRQFEGKYGTSQI